MLITGKYGFGDTGMRRMLLGDILFPLSMVALWVDGLLERLLGRMGVAFGSISKKVGEVLLAMFTLKWEMVLRPSFGMMFGVGIVV